jgi:tetratricopeptide (TPR) repeat protein
LGNYQEALNNAEKAAEILKNALDENHWRYAYTVRGQAQVLLEMERFQEAKKKMDEAIEIINTNYPSNAAFKAYFNATYANIYEELNELDKAAQYYDQSISFLKEGLGETHPLLRETLTSYAKMEMGRQNHKKALPFLKEALKIQKHNERGEEELQVTQKLLGKCQKALNSSSSIPASS